MSVDSSAIVRSCELQLVAYSDPTVPELPSRMVGNNMHKYSRVIGPQASPACYSPFDVKHSDNVRPRRQRSAVPNSLRAMGVQESMNVHLDTVLPSDRISDDAADVLAASTVVDRVDDSSSGVAVSSVSHRVSHHRHSFRTALTSLLLACFLLLCVLIPLGMLALLHMYGTDADKRSEDFDERRRPGAASMGRTLWLWTARSAPRGCIALLRLVHTQLLQPPPTSISSVSSPQSSLSRAPSLTSFQRSTSVFAVRVDDRDGERAIVA